MTKTNRDFIRNNLIPTMVWLAVALAPFSWPRNPITALLAFRCLIVAGCFLSRQQPHARSGSFQTWASRLSALIPLGLSSTVGTGGGDLFGLTMMILGMSLATLACVDLGASFGVSPAIRPYVQSGIYRWMPHPMYIGQAIAEAGIVTVSPTPRNLAILALSWAGYLIRIRWESTLVKNNLISVRDQAAPRALTT